MSRQVLTAILAEMQIWLNEIEREHLYHELTAYLGLIGALNWCQAFRRSVEKPKQPP